MHHPSHTDRLVTPAIAQGGVQIIPARHNRGDPTRLAVLRPTHTVPVECEVRMRGYVIIHVTD